MAWPLLTLSSQLWRVANSVGVGLGMAGLVAAPTLGAKTHGTHLDIHQGSVNLDQPYLPSVLRSVSGKLNLTPHPPLCL